MGILDRILRRNKVFMCRKCGRGYPYKKGETAIVLWYGTYCRPCGLAEILADENENLGWRGYIQETGAHFYQRFVITSDPNILELEVRHGKEVHRLTIDIEKMEGLDKEKQRAQVKAFYHTMMDIPKLHHRRGRVPAIPHDM